MKPIKSINEIHKKLFSLIEIFASFCDRNYFKYPLAYETCLRAIRHKYLIFLEEVVLMQI